jgi:hypothetical protein
MPIEAQSLRNEGMPFGMANAKCQIPKMISGICDVKSGIPSAREESLLQGRTLRHAMPPPPTSWRSGRSGVISPAIRFPITSPAPRQRSKSATTARIRMGRRAPRRKRRALQGEVDRVVRKIQAVYKRRRNRRRRAKTERRGLNCPAASCGGIGIHQGDLS